VQKSRRLPITRGMAVRMFADALMVQFALFAALMVRFFSQVFFETHLEDRAAGVVFRDYLADYFHSAGPLTLICLAIFYLCGFYTYGRFYQGRYKALIVAQAVSQSYLIFGFVQYFIHGELPLARGALVMAWLFSVVLLVGARLWVNLWEKIVHPERMELLRAGQRQGRKVLVIGGGGYIGSALLRKLLDKGYKVRLLDLLLYGTEPIDEVLHHPNLEIIRGDFRHVDKVVEAMHGVDAVVHLGAIVGDPACELDRELTVEVNLSATRMIAEVAKLSRVSRFMFASTCSVYGACDELLDERSLVKPVSLYGYTKLAAERVLREMATDEFQPTLLRFATIYGLSGRTRFDLVVNLLAAKAKIDGQITVFGGDQWRPFVHVDDAALAVLMALEAPLEVVGNQVFNVGSDEQNYTITQIGEMVHQHVHTAELIVKSQDSDPRNYRVSFAKIRNQLGFVPQWTVDQGIEQVLEAIARGEVGDYRDAKHSNVKFLSEPGSPRLARDNWAQQLLQEITTGN
jgi:nucleoside-diphosphate-sugar epimerase